MTDTLTIAAQYLLEWESFRYPEGGTYLGPVDFVFNGPDRVVWHCSTCRQLGRWPDSRRLSRGGPNPKQRGEWGLVGTLEPGVARRHGGLLLPQLLRQAAAWCC